MSTYKVTGKTYNARNLLNEVGFVYDSKSKNWYGNQAAMDELQRVSTATHSRGNQKLVAALKIEEVKA